MANRMTIGVDFGGTSSKATLIDETGKVLATATKEYVSHYPHPGWVEQDPEDLYNAFIYNVRELLSKSGANSEDIVAIAVDAATHMAVFLDENDKPLRPIIHWSDSRSSKQVAWLKANKMDLLKRYTLNTPSAGWNLPQFLWLQENEPDVLKNTKHLLFAKDYVRHRITGDYYTDYIEAMGAMLSDDKTAEWVPELCELGGIDINAMPEVKAPTDIAGTVSAEVAAETGLSTKTKVLVGTTDTALEVYASGAVEVGCATVKLATAGRICPITTGPVDSPFFFNYKHLVPDLWYPGTGTRSCAASYKWFRDTFGDYEKVRAERGEGNAFDLMNDLAAAVPPGSEKMFFHPYLLGEMTPYNNDKLRASYTGVGMYHTKGHFVRATMEGISFSMRDSLEEIRRNNVRVDQFRVIGGGAKSPLWSQILCDILGEPLWRTQNNDSSLGSAMMAGVACGLFESFADSVEKCVKVSGFIEPIAENVKVYEENFQFYREIQRAMAPIYEKMI